MSLGRELGAIRTEARLSQGELGKLAGISRNSVGSIEREEWQPKAPTLRALADGAATDGAGTRDPVKADAFYGRLMRAAGYIEDRPADPEPSRSVDDLTDEEVTDELERRFGDREVAVSFLAAAKNWRNLDPRSQRLVLETVRYAAGEDDEPTPSLRTRR